MPDNFVSPAAQIEFAVFCIENTAEFLGKDPIDVYDSMKKCGVLDEYIIPCCDILHTQGKEYIINDVLEEMKKRGAKI